MGQDYTLANLGAGLPTLPSRSAVPPDYSYGPRWNEASQNYSGPPKGLGWLGPLKNPNGDVMSEYSIDEDINGRNVSMPSLVPTLTKAEVQQVLKEQITPEIRQKAIRFALTRLMQGKSPFAGEGEQMPLYPDLPRAEIPTRADQQMGTLANLGVGIRRR